MKVVVTGARGFVGRSLTRHMFESGFSGRVRLVDRELVGDEPYESLALNLTAEGSVARAIEGADCVVHLAALPGAASEDDPATSRFVNFEIAHEIIRHLHGRRLIYASSIAVLGSDFQGTVNDATPTDPDTVYGTHKRMVELAFADAVDAGVLTGLSLRLPCIVARPRSSAGFGSAFLSDVFHAAWEGADYTVPVAREATAWLMSAQTCARNLLRAVQMATTDGDAMNLPALRVGMGDLVTELANFGDTGGIDFAERPELRKSFGSHPALHAPRAERLGFVSDGDVASLISRAGAPAYARSGLAPDAKSMEKRA
jgi:nucleoside-diphosphate-sugar epimerase